MNLLIRSEELIVVINEVGAEVCSVKNTGGNEYIWQADPAVWARHAPVLFPIVGKLKEEYFLYNDKKFCLSQHGFARDLKFKVCEKEDQRLVLELTSSDETKKLYPYSFVFQIEYILTSNKLQTNYTVMNTGNEVMFFSIGAHPGFMVESMEKYFLAFEKDELLLSRLQNGLLSSNTERLLLKDKKLLLRKELFDNDALIFENSQINNVSLCSTKTGRKITMKCEQWPYFGVWSKKGNDSFVCLEPWYGITDTIDADQQLKNKKGIIQLSPQRTFGCSFELIFD